MTVSIPVDTACGRILRQDVRVSNFRLTPLRLSSQESRELAALTEAAGESRLTLRLDIQLSRNAMWPVNGAATNLTTALRAKYLEETPEIRVHSPAVVDTLRQLQQPPSGEQQLVERIFEHCRTLPASSGNAGPSDVAGTRAEDVASPLGRVRAMVGLCRAGSIPARLVTGFEIRESSEARVQYWMEALVNRVWVPFDPTRGYAKELPFNFLPIRFDDSALVRIRGRAELETEWTITQLPFAPESPASKTRVRGPSST